MVATRRLEGSSFGLEVYGLDLRRGLPDEVVDEIADSLHEHRLLEPVSTDAP